MRYAVLLRQRPDGTYQASVPLIPDLFTTGETRAEALEAAREALTATLDHAELLYLDLPQKPSSNPWLTTAGMFADDETLESMLQEIYSARDIN